MDDCALTAAATVEGVVTRLPRGRHQSEYHRAPIVATKVLVQHRTERTLLVICRAAAA
ncbi:hypothetical protein [Rhodococcus sp. JVH1]|uniref:hypothetical protein n=1 Tax=Rhodococcus sp. JVH1 TaxID=745408 RepID=UPI0002F9F63A